jgi:hypothetical protein
MHQMSQEMQQCIRNCLDCYETCKHESMNHCLEAGGKHVEPTHFRLMSACAEICRTAADVMLTGAELHTRVCAACAEICEACAKNCEDMGDMDRCVAACRRCAESCRRMAGGSAHGFTGSAQQRQVDVKAPM